MKQKLIISMFSLLILLQVASPLYMIVKRELVLKHGIPFRFKTAPIDPYDPMRGRYVALRIEANKAPKPQGVNLKPKQKAYAEIAADENGNAKIAQITLQKPKSPSFLDVTINSISDNEIFLNIPIDRYYMEETAAPQAEKIYRKYNERNKQDAYVIVRIRNGYSVVEGLYVDNKKIETLISK